MAEDVLLAFDVGGTNTRARVGVIRAGDVAPHPDFPEPLTAPIAHAADLYGFVRALLSDLSPGERVAAAVFDIAGPVTEGRQALMTNWADRTPLDVGDLVALGLPRGRTVLVNDLFAGALGLVSRLQREGIGSPSFEPVYVPDEGPGDLSGGHLAFVAPGTGLGSSGIVRIATREGFSSYTPVACEVQHTLVPAFADDVRGVIDRVWAERGAPPTWEDLVSGRGLESLHRAVCGAAPEVPEGQDVAGWVAARAAEADAACEAALGMYYRVAGRFAQMLALTFLPCSAVFLGGETSVKNRGFLLERSRFAEEFLDNAVQGRLLAATPVYLVQAEVNLEGSLTQAMRLARERVVVGTTA